MNVFISSVISGMESERRSVKEAVETLGHRAVVAEEFGASPSSPQIACLSHLRQSDAFVLILGPRYGTTLSSGVSATHEEFRAAHTARLPLFVFVVADDMEAKQAELVREVGPWASGIFFDTYSDAADLGRKTTRALHKYALAQASSPLDPKALSERAIGLLSRSEHKGSSRLTFALAAGPDSVVLRPSQMDDQAIVDAIEQQLLFARPPLFNRKDGVEHRLAGQRLAFEQSSGRSACVSLFSIWTNGDVTVDLPLLTGGTWESGLPVVIEEDVTQRLRDCMTAATWWLDYIDPTQRLSHVAFAVQLTGGAMMAWRTRQQHQANPHTVRGGSLFCDDEARDAPAMLTPAHYPRQALAVQGDQFVEDLVALLRRRWADH